MNWTQALDLISLSFLIPDNIELFSWQRLHLHFISFLFISRNTMKLNRVLNCLGKGRGDMFHLLVGDEGWALGLTLLSLSWPKTLILNLCFFSLKEQPLVLKYHGWLLQLLFSGAVSIRAHNRTAPPELYQNTVHPHPAHYLSYMAEFSVSPNVSRSFTSNNYWLFFPGFRIACSSSSLVHAWHTATTWVSA